MSLALGGAGLTLRSLQAGASAAFGKELELRLLNRRAASCAGVQGVSGRGPPRHCLESGVLSGRCARPGPAFDTCARNTKAARASRDRVFIAVGDPEHELYF